MEVFREATWDEALDLAGGGCARSATRTARKALAGFGSAKGSNEEAYLFQKLVRTGFGSNNVDHCTRLCHASRRWRRCWKASARARSATR
jgi:formate dehydrogenase major subunit